MRHEFSCDAHMIPGVASDRKRPYVGAFDSRGSFSHTQNAIVIDVDCPWEKPADAWREAELAKVKNAAASHSDPFYYETRGGYRIVWLTPTPFVIDSPEQARLWARQYTVVLAYLRRRFGIQGDPACSDFTRLFRLPLVRRDGVQERRRTWGDPSDIGPLAISKSDLSDSDFERAKSCGHVWRPHRFTSAPTAGGPGDGRGFLWHLLNGRGLIDRPCSGGGWFVRCPQAELHSKAPRRGGTDTKLFPPMAGRTLGAIHCFHAHCVDMTQRDWLDLFTPSEVDAARIASGEAETDNG
ncbi:MAG: hypothetical protein AAGF92_17745 [Myxococcota bacterium]